jgi:membrane protease YdiL (CAAX protease family)
MTSETLFTIGFAVVAIAVLLVLITGGVLWVRWFLGKSRRNLTGDRSPRLLDQQRLPTPAWSPFDFLIAIGLLYLIAGLVNDALKPAAPPAQPTETRPQTPVDGKVDQKTATSRWVAADLIATIPLMNLIAAEQPAVANGELADSESADSEPAERESAEREPQKGDVADSDAEEPDGAETGPTDPATLHRQLQVHFIAQAGSFAIMMLVMLAIRQASFVSLGMIPTWADVRRGAIATVWILCPVLLINIVIANLVKYEHAVTNLIAVDQSVVTFGFLFFSAAVMTPIVEEFQFRLLLQGGLQKIADLGPRESATETFVPRSIWPIFVASGVFAIMHLGQGAAPIPLFFLAVGLGFLYRSSGRLTPVIVVHMLLNGTTLLVEFLRVNAGITS